MVIPLKPFKDANDQDSEDPDQYDHNDQPSQNDEAKFGGSQHTLSQQTIQIDTTGGAVAEQRFQAEDKKNEHMPNDDL